MSERFYINWPLTPGPVELCGPEARHLATVCRLRAGDSICLFNGDGRDYPALVRDVKRRVVLLEVTGVAERSRELGFRLEVAAPLPKGDRIQFLIEKLTELGAAAFVPLLCRRSALQPSVAKIDKLQRYVIEASKQCGRNVLMEVCEPVAWEVYCQRNDVEAVRVLADPGGAAKFPVVKAASTVRCALGPEGGFTEEEIQLARKAGWLSLSLGSRILRVETAALALAVLAESRQEAP